MTVLTERTPYDRAVLQFKHEYIYAVLMRHRGNRCKAAIELGIHRNTMSRLIAQTGIEMKDIRDCVREGR